MLPNLFQFATSELSQDAFICWLVSWADKRYEKSHEALHQTAISLLDRFLELAGISRPEEYVSVEIKQQEEKVDVFIRLNSEIVILVEDKTHTDQHSNQLTRYLEAIRRKFPNDRVAAIYFKTGDQSSYRAIEDAGFQPFRRQDFLAILRTGASKGIENEIYLDYFRCLQHQDKLVGEFATLPLGEWHSACWIGFFMELQKLLGDGNWGHVPNPSGGFKGYWWHGTTNYLLLHEGKLCFKVEVEDKSQQAVRWEEWHAVVMTEATRTGLEFTRPRRRAGISMTVAVMEGDYRKTDDRGLLDIEQTLVVLRRAEAMLDDSVARFENRSSAN